MLVWGVGCMVGDGDFFPFLQGCWAAYPEGGEFCWAALAVFDRKVGGNSCILLGCIPRVGIFVGLLGCMMGGDFVGLHEVFFMRSFVEIVYGCWAA